MVVVSPAYSVITTYASPHHLARHTVPLIVSTRKCNVSLARATVGWKPTAIVRSMSTRKSRPSRNAIAPPSTIAGLYCHTCGRIITPRKSHAKSLNTSTPPKYCSDRCRREKPPAHGDGVEAEIERTFVELLGNSEGGSSRKVVACWDVEAEVFGAPVHGSDAKSPENSDSNSGEASSGQTSEDNEDGGVPVNEHPVPAASLKWQHTIPEGLTPQQLGRQRASNREKVRQAARRGAVFGFSIHHGTEPTDASSGSKQRLNLSRDRFRRRKVEAVQGGRIVEASFAKGPWGVRWKDEHG